MRLSSVRIENFRAIDDLALPLHPQINVLVGENAAGKTSVIEAIAVGLGAILTYLPECRGRDFKKNDLRTTFVFFLGWGASDSPIPRPAPPPPVKAPLGGHSPAYVRVTLSAESGPTWDRSSRRDKTGLTALLTPPAIGVAPLRQFLDPIIASIQTGGDLSLPILAYYGTDRAVPDIPQRQRNFRKQFSRFAALDGALEAGFRFKDIFEWLVTQEDLERRAKEERRDFGYRLPLLDAVRTAVSRSLPGCTNPHTELQPLRLVVDVPTAGNECERLELDQLSGGYRVMFALVVDLARRMAQANPHLGANAIDAAGIVLIDEVDLHLHPRWQQRVLPDLTRAFPNIQFIVSTHSPQVLTTVRPEQIVRLDHQRGQVIAESAESSLGAESGRLLEEIFGVDQRPPAETNEFSHLLAQYAALVSVDQGEEAPALDLRRQLDALSSADPGLIRLDMEIRRRRVLRQRNGGL